MRTRGTRPKTGSTNDHGHRRSHIGITLALTIFCSCSTTLTLIAQDTPAPTPKTVMLRVAGVNRQVVTTGDTVQAVLHQEKITLNSHDKIEPAVTTPISDGMTVTVYRVTFEIIDERVSIPPPVVTRWDRRMTVNPVTLRAGVPGVAVQKRCVWKKDGKISVQWTQGRKVVTQPRPAVVIRGRLASRGITGRRVLRMVSTAYDPGPGSCGRYADGYTAIGMRAMKGVVAVDPRVIPLGSRVYVDGYGPAIAGDTGGAIKGNRIDVCFSSRAEALRWGRRTVDVVVME